VTTENATTSISTVVPAGWVEANAGTDLDFSDRVALPRNLISDKWMEVGSQTVAASVRPSRFPGPLMTTTGYLADTAKVIGSTTSVSTGSGASFTIEEALCSHRTQVPSGSLGRRIASLTFEPRIDASDPRVSSRFAFEIITLDGSASTEKPAWTPRLFLALDPVGAAPQSGTQVEALVESYAPELLAAADDVEFQDAIESEFSRRLTAFVVEHGAAGVEAVGRIVNHVSTSDEIAWEALRWVGRIDDPVTYRCRLVLLEETLASPRPRLRDGAALAISSMDDPIAVPHLRRAIESEDHADLRADMEAILKQLDRG
jgi:hypothetical protein